MKALLRLCLLALLFSAGTAAATQLGVNAINNWKTADLCAAQAQKAHPDFTAVENAKREEALNRCLESHNLPPRTSSPPPR